jgi:uncharacterized protein (DUF58 family)
VDWKLFARTDRAYLRLSPDRTVLPTMVVVDASESMDFPAGAASKLNRARQLSVALAAVAHQEGDPVGVAVAGKVTAVFRPRTRGGVVGEIASLLDQVVPASGGSLTEALGAATRLAQRVVLIGDLLSGDEPLIALLRSHVLRGGEGYVAQIVAAEELEPVPGAVHDPERPDQTRVLDEAGTDAYRQAFARWRDDVAARCRAAGVPYVLSRTDEAAGPEVRRIVAAGSVLTAR